METQLQDFNEKHGSYLMTLEDDLMGSDNLSFAATKNDQTMDSCGQNRNFRSEEDYINRQKFLRIMNSGKVPHFSVLEDVEMGKQALLCGLSHVFTDNVGNTIVFGSYEWYEKDGQKIDQPLKIAYDSGAMLGKNSELAKQNLVRGRRRVDTDDNPFHSANRYLNNQGWLDLMREREAKGKVNFPYIYLVDDTDPITLNKTIDAVKKYGLTTFFIVAGAVLSVVSFGAMSPLLAAAVTAGITTLSTVGVKWSTGQPITIKDLKVGVIAFIDALSGGAGSNANNTTSGLSGTERNEWLELGVDVMQSLESGNIGTVANELLKNGTAKDLIDSITSGDSTNLSSIIGGSLEQAQALIQGFTSSNMMKNLTENADEIVEKAKQYGNAFKVNEVASYFESVIANPNIAGVIPGSITAIKAVMQTQDLSPEQFNTLLKMLQGSKVSQDEVALYSLESVIAKARASKTKTYVLPETIPADWKDFFVYWTNYFVPEKSTIALDHSNMFPEFL